MLFRHHALGFTCLLVAPTLAACSEGGSDEGGFSTFTTAPGDGDGDPGETGDGDGDGDGDPGDGDGDLANCGDSIVDAGEQCDLGPQNSDAGQCTTACQIASCGDGLVYEGFEECDDANPVNTDDCISDCKLAVCGDAYTQAGVEACDDGNDDETDGCTSSCVTGVCGDGILQMGEQCDDANMDTSDDCPACQLAFCGDGYIQAGIEVCDDGNLETTDGCISPLCVPATCGDGYLWAGMETCDDGNVEDADACPTSCAPSYCGDGFTWAGMEECDDGNDDEMDGCTSMCEALYVEFMFTDTPQDDIAATAVRDFFMSVPNPQPTTWIMFEVLVAPSQGAWCATGADWYISQYLSLAQAGGNSQSGNWNKYVRNGGPMAQWSAVMNSPYTNYWGASCGSSAWDWCSEWGMGGLSLAVMPGSAGNNGECYDNGWSNGANWQARIRVGPSRMSACGF
jgi:cysteine-rich repeat protein